MTIELAPVDEALVHLGVPSCGRCNRPSVRFFVHVPLRELHHGVTGKAGNQLVWMELVSGSAPHSKRFVCSECRDAIDKHFP